jgi:hypothetical protein
LSGDAQELAGEPGEVRVELATTPARALADLARVAEEQGGSFESAGASGGRLRIPVVAGLRRGWVSGTVTAISGAGTTTLSFRGEESAYHLQRSSVAVLVLGALGGLAFLVAPLVPALVPALPLAAMLAFASWLFVVAGLRNSGPEELLASLTEPDEPASDAQPTE